MAISPRTELVDGRHLRAVAFNEVRIAYASEQLRLAGLDPAGRRALVVGSVRGDLARGLAALGLEVTAADPAPASTELAEERDPAGRVRYVTAQPAVLGGLGGPFDLVYCADTFEIVADLDAVAGAAAGVLTPDGLLIYDTVTRTALSRLIYLGLFQRLPMTRIVPPDTYAAGRLRPPAEVIAALAAHGLRSVDVRGFKPSSAVGLVRAVLDRRAGRITDDEVPSATGFVLEKAGRRPMVTYLGAARR